MAGEWIPCGTIQSGNGLIVDVFVGEQSNTMSAIGVEVHAGDVAMTAGATFMTLKEEVRAIVIIGIGAFLILENKVGVLIRFGLSGFYLVNGRGQISGHRDWRCVVVVAVVAG